MIAKKSLRHKVRTLFVIVSNRSKHSHLTKQIILDSFCDIQFQFLWQTPLQYGFILPNIPNQSERSNYKIECM
jgi:hypothetical protein